MKSLVACILVISLVGSAICARHRRQAPPVPEAAAPEGALEGAPEDFTTPANTKVDGINTALAFILADLSDDAAKGAPLDPKKVDTVNKLTLIVSVLGGDLSESNKQAIEDLEPAAEAAAADDSPAA